MDIGVYFILFGVGLLFFMWNFGPISKNYEKNHKTFESGMSIFSLILGIICFFGPVYVYIDWYLNSNESFSDDPGGSLFILLFLFFIMLLGFGFMKSSFKKD